MVKFNLRAVLPVAQYSNIQPEWEVEADTYEEAMAIAEGHLVPFWNKYVEGGKELKTAQGTLIKGFCGGEIYYEPISHVYTWEGAVYESSSNYASKFDKPFDTQKIAEATAKKYGVSKDEIIAMWKLKGKISRDMGTVLHEAIQLRRQYEAVGKALGKDGHVHLSPMVKDAVEELMKLLPVGKEAIEEIVIDHPNKKVSRIDLIRITGNQRCRVVDYKTGEMKDKYWKQLEFSADILERNDWTVEGLDILHWDGSWHPLTKEYKFLEAR